MCLAKIWPLVFLNSPHHLLYRFWGPQDGDFGFSSGGYQGRGVRPRISIWGSLRPSVYLLASKKKCSPLPAPAQLITAPTQPPATGVAVYTALFYVSFDPELHFTIMYSNEICFYDEGCGTNPPCSIIKMLSILSLSCGMSVAMSSTFFTALIGHTATGWPSSWLKSRIPWVCASKETLPASFPRRLAMLSIIVSSGSPSKTCPGGL